MNLTVRIGTSSIPHDFIVKALEYQSNLTYSAVVPDQTVVQPHTVPVGVVFTGLDRRSHRIEIWDAVTNQLLSWEAATPDTSSITFDLPIIFTVGQGSPYPNDGANTFNLAGVLSAGTEIAEVEKFGAGSLIPTTEWTYNPTSQDFTLQGSYVFGDGERYTLRPRPATITTPVNDSVVGKIVGGFVDVFSPRTYSVAVSKRKCMFSCWHSLFLFPCTSLCNSTIVL